MKKNKLLGVLFAGLMLISVNVTAFAASPTSGPDVKQEYQRLIAEGILGEDVPLEYWIQLKEREKALEKMLEESDEFSCVSGGLDAQATATFSMEKGDVVITNGTSSNGLTGHAGIAISPYFILHIAGPGLNPAVITLTKWNSIYTAEGWTKIYRHSKSNVADAAGQWAYDTYHLSDAEYKITMDLSTTHETYCSKIVWQAYYYGPDTHYANGPTLGIRAPYDLPITVFNLSLETTYE